MLVILVPVLDRPQNVMPLLDSIRESTPEPYSVLFIADPDDHAERQAITAANACMIVPGGSYSSKINDGVRATTEPLVLLAADDIRPRPGWFQAACAALMAGAQVVGLNDLIPRPHRPGHATHFLMTREYATLPCIDGSRGPLYEGYAAWYCDDELVATATKRRVYAYAEDAHVEHRHPMVNTAPDDETYRKGRSTARMDGKRFARRMHLWNA